MYIVPVSGKCLEEHGGGGMIVLLHSLLKRGKTGIVAIPKLDLVVHSYLWSCQLVPQEVARYLTAAAVRLRLDIVLKSLLYVLLGRKILKYKYSLYCSACGPCATWVLFASFLFTGFLCSMPIVCPFTFFLYFLFCVHKVVLRTSKIKKIHVHISVCG